MFCKSVTLYVKVAGVFGVKVNFIVTMPGFFKI